MGLTCGRAVLRPEVTPFVNLPRVEVEAVWESFNDVAEGFGLVVAELQEILRVALREYLGFQSKRLDNMTAALFETFDDDRNGLVDALEVLAAIGVLSGMSQEEKIAFVFNVFDFDESGELSIDECVLCLRSAISGLCKVAGALPPPESEVEQLSLRAFRDGHNDPEGRITRAEFVALCQSAPEVVSQLGHFGEFADALTRPGEAEPEPDAVAPPPERSAREAAVMDLDHGHHALLALQEAAVAEEFQPIEPWEATMAYITPADAADVSALPLPSLDLEWVYGYSARGARGTVRYSQRGEIVYPAGAVVVVYNPATHAQKHFVQHNDHVTALAMLWNESALDVVPGEASPHNSIVATGELGARPKVLVWDGETLELLKVLSGFHRRGIAALDFSPSGELLVSVDMDAAHNVAVYDWRQARHIFAAPSTTLPVLACRWLGDEDSFGTCGVDHVFFWRRAGPEAQFVKSAGLFGTKGQRQAQLCMEVVGEQKTVITGTASGHLYTWVGRSCVAVQRAHVEAVSVLHAVADQRYGGMVSGSSDGRVRVWNSQLELGATFEVAALGGFAVSVRSVFWDPRDSKILLGTAGAEIFEMSSDDGDNLHATALVSGHYEQRATCVATHPTRHQFITVAQDCTVRQWDPLEHRPLNSVHIDTAPACAAYSADGEFVALGLAGPNGGPREGALVVLLSENLTVAHETRDSRAALTCVAFSPDSESLAVGSADHCIYLYHVQDWSAKGKCRGHEAPVRCIDFSEDSMFLQSNCDAKQLLFWDATSGEGVAPAKCANQLWHRSRCVYSWASQGAWSRAVSGGRIGAVAVSADRNTLAAADCYGALRVFRAPCTRRDANLRAYRGHAPEVRSLAFICDDSLLVSLGESDCCAFQWRHVPDAGVSDVRDPFEPEWDSDDALDFADGAALERAPLLDAAINDNARVLASLEEASKQDGLMENRPWMGALVAPSGFTSETTSAPNGDLALEWVHGFRARDCRGNVQYSSNGDVVFHAGSTAVSLNLNSWTQSFNQQHTDEIVSLAVHPSLPLAATGQLGAVPAIVVWDTNTMQTLAVLKGVHRRAVSSLAFSRRGKFLASAGQDDFHQLVVYNWANQAVVASSRSSADKTLDLIFLGTNTEIVQCANNSLLFWTMRGRNLHSRHAVLGDRGRRQPFMCAGALGANAVVGTADGSIYLFQGRQLREAVQAHEGPINSLMTTARGVITGGKDAKVKLWNQRLELTLEIDMSALPSLDPCVRSVYWHLDGNKLLVGTRAAEVFELSPSDGANLHGFGPLLSGHYKGELWGLATHPVNAEYYTVGDDATLRCWSLETKKLLRQTALEMASRAVALSPDGRNIAVGYGAGAKHVPGKPKFDGKWQVLDDDNFSVIHEARDSKRWISEIKYSPNGAVLAVGSTDHKIYLYDTLNSYTSQAIITQHEGAILHFDFSADSDYLQSNCDADTLVFSEADTGVHIPAASRLNDVRWSTHTCPRSWRVSGVWPQYALDSEISAVDMAASGAVVASASEFGKVALHRAPCTLSSAPRKTYHGHAAPVAKVRWATGDSHVVSIGARDRCVFQWAHTRDTLAEDDEDTVAMLDLSGGESSGGEDSADEEASADEAEAGAGGGEAAAGAPAQAEGKRGWRGKKKAQGEQQQQQQQKDGDQPGGVSLSGAIVAPTRPGKLDPSAPEGVTMRVEHVHGGPAARSTRSAVFYNAQGDVVFPAARAGVVYSRADHRQRIFAGHEADIAGITVSSDGAFAATGETARLPCVRVWDAVTCNEVRVLANVHRRGVPLLGFAPGRRRLVTVGLDASHTMAVWHSRTGEWHDAVLQATAVTSVARVHFATFLSPASGFQLASGGDRHMTFWTLGGRALAGSAALYNSIGQKQPLLCAASMGELTVTGTASGHLYVWQGRGCIKMIKSSRKAVNSLFACPAGLASGAADGVVKLWTRRLELVGEFDLKQLSGTAQAPLSCAVRSVCAKASQDGSEVLTLLAVTASTEVVEICRHSGRMLTLSAGHYSQELWGLAAHPIDGDVFATTGDDKTLRVWSVAQRRVLRQRKLDNLSRAVCWSADGLRIIVGVGGTGHRNRQRYAGKFFVYDAETLALVHSGRDAQRGISCIRASPDGNVLAIAASDQKIYLYDGRTYALRAQCEKHNAYITHMDFSADCSYLQSNCGSLELRFANAVDGTSITAPSQLRDVKWHDWTCTLGWPVQAPFRDATGIDVTAAHQTRDKKHVVTAVAGDSGAIRVYNFPSVAETAEFVEFEGPCSYITNVQVTADDRHVIAIGGRDRAVVQFALETPASAATAAEEAAMLGSSLLAPVTLSADGGGEEGVGGVEESKS